MKYWEIIADKLSKSRLELGLPDFLKSGRPTSLTRSREKSHERELAARGFRPKGRS